MRFSGFPDRRCGGWALVLVPAIALAIAGGPARADDSAPCTGPSALLPLVDRPTVGDSSCIVPAGSTVLETGVTLGRLSGLPGDIDTGPNLELRWGLADDSELVWLPPNYQYQHTPAVDGQGSVTLRGLGASSLGIKHQLGYTGHWQWTAETLATLPSGSRHFGSAGLGVAANAIVSYSSDGPFGASLMVGVTSATGSVADGGQRFVSVNPDFVVTWQSTARLQLYAEVYAQSHTAHGEQWGTDADGGVQYLVTPRLEVDVEEGVRIEGNLGGFAHYAGVGMALLY